MLSDGKTHAPATATLAGDKVIVLGAVGFEPTHVRYAYEPDPKVNLVNSADLPAVPFEMPID